MNEKHWTYTFVLSALSSFVILIFSNVIIDPFNIFQTDLFKRHFQINERYLKIEFLENNKNRINTYLFGSSRIGTTDPAVIETSLPGSRAYNMSVSAANIYDYVEHLNYLIRNSYPVETIYLQLDLQDMVYFGHSRDDYLLRLHPDVLQENRLSYYWKYLTIIPMFNFKGKILQNLTPDNETYVEYDIDDSGMWFIHEKEKQIRSDPEQYIDQEISFHYKATRSWGINRSQYGNIIHGLEEISRVCRNNNIRLILFLSPLNHTILDMFTVDDVLLFLEDIANIHGYWFFSDYNTFTCDDHFYYEAGHYRGVLGRRIAGRIFNDTTMTVPSDFGFYIRKNQFGRYKDRIRQNYLHGEAICESVTDQSSRP